MGKNTLAVKIGDRATRALYVGSLLGAFTLIAVAAGLAGRPGLLLGLVGLIPAAPATRIVMGGATGRDLIPVLEATGKTQLIAGALMTVGLLF